MKKLLRLLFRLLLIVVLIFAAIVAFNSFNFNSLQRTVDPIGQIKIDDTVFDRLGKAVQIPTVSYDNRIDTTAFVNFQHFLKTNYPFCDSLLEYYTVNEYSFVYKWPGIKAALEPILLMAHIDVVPVEAESEKRWTHPPFSGKKHDGYIWGRGTLDDKVNILAILEAMEGLLMKGYQPERSIYLACGHDEEVGGQAGAKAIARRFKQQGITFEYILDEGSVILKDALAGLDRPAALIGICEKGYTTLELRAQLANGGHSSMASPGDCYWIAEQCFTKTGTKSFSCKPGWADENAFCTCWPGDEINLFRLSWLTFGYLKIC